MVSNRQPPAAGREPLRGGVVTGPTRVTLATIALTGVVAGLVVLTARARATARFDLVIIGGRVVDGTGAPWMTADVGVSGDTITAIGALGDASAGSRIDAAGLVVAPGFIDMLGWSEFNLLVDNRAASKITQGITTEITGEGTSIAPLDDRMAEARRETWAHYGLTLDFRTLDQYFRRLETRARPALNLGTFVGAGGVRTMVVGLDDRPATADEITRMKDIVARAMQEGALGLSSSLQYVPDRFASTDELVELARVAAAHGGIYITHQRSEGHAIDASLDEVFTVAERARIPAEIWHLKTAYAPNWGRMPAVLRRIEAARARGLDVTANMYPYDRAANDLDACLPLWVREGGTEKMLARLRDAGTRARIRDAMEDGADTSWENQWVGSGGASGVLLISVLNPALSKYEGRTIAEIAVERGVDPRDALMDLVVADKGQSSAIISIMSEADVRDALAHPLLSIGTDAGAKAEDGPLSSSKSHPRAWGSFPRVLGKYVREERLIPLEEAVRRFTSRPAARVGLRGRGLLRPGFKADIAIFDPAAIRDVSTFADPNHYSVGVRHVFVNGRAVVADGRITEERPGRVLRGPGAATD
jgi:dihydroorotase/N-acyl-D-amino-acid deacylase